MTYPPPPEPTHSEPYDLTPYDAVLQAYVTDDGGVRYAALASDEAARAQLDTFISTVAAATPTA